MGEEEVARFLTEERTLICATLGPRGWPHLMPLWYVPREIPPGDPGPQLWSWTYAASQKTRNLERDPRATVTVEAGELYHELRGVMLECEVLLHRDLETVGAFGRELFARYASPRGEPPPAELPAEVDAMVGKQAAKRVAMQFVERRRATWDHRKLGGVY
jgi:Pyridoxamine 5'-phosphate oxidase